MEFNDNLKFSGFPENEFIEIPDKPSPSPRKFDGMSLGLNLDFESLNNLSVEDFKKMLPEELINDIEKSAPGQVDKIIEASVNQAKEIFSNIKGSGISDELKSVLEELYGEDDSDGYDDENTDQLLSFNLGSIDFLSRQLIGSITVRPLMDGDEAEFINNFKTMDIKLVDPILEKLEPIKVSSLEVAYTDPYFMVFKANLEDENLLHFYLFGIRGESGLSLFMPAFMNTLNVSNDRTEIRYFNKNDEADKPFFDSSGEFFPFNLMGLLMGIRTLIVPVKKVLMSPALFGEFKPVKVPINSDGNFIQVGNLISNESAEAILLKKDAELNLDETKFPFYFNFDKSHDAENLRYLQDIIFKQNLNNSALFHYSELKYKNGILYIDVNFGDF